MLGFFVLCCLFVWYIYHNFIRKRKSLPPGPTPLPLIGNMLLLDKKNSTKTFEQLTKVYGPVFTFWFGCSPTIMVTDYQLIKEGLMKQGEAFSGRPQVPVFKLCQGGEWHGLVNSTGQLWKEQRRFSLQVMRNIGVGRSVMEEKINNQVDRMVKHTRSLIGGSGSKIINIDDLEIQWWIGNIISNIAIGHNFSKETYHKLKDLIDRQFVIASKPYAALLMSFPWLRHVPVLGGFGFKQLQDHTKELFGFMMDQIRENETSNPDNSEEATSFTQAYLQELRQRRENGENLGTFSEYQLAACLTDLWVAGMDTTVATLGWALMYMVHHPEIQEKCQKEIDDVLYGRGEKVLRMSDRNLTPFLAATVQEIQRRANILPMNLPRALITDTEFAGYKFVKDTVFSFQIANVMSNPKIFSEPQRFNPDRFLNSEGTGIKKSEEFVPFSMGKRSCIGESLARMELYLIFGTILQKFRVSRKPGCDLPALEPEISATLKVKPFEMLVEDRECGVVISGA